MQITLAIKADDTGVFGRFTLHSGQDIDQLIPPEMCLEIATALGRLLRDGHPSPGTELMQRALRTEMEAEIQALVEGDQKIQRQILRLLPDEEKATS